MVKVSFRREYGWVQLVYIILLKVVLGETCSGAVCVHRNVKCSFWIDPLLGAVCVHHIFKGSFWRDLRFVLCEYIEMLMVAIGETCFRCC